MTEVTSPAEVDQALPPALLLDGVIKRYGSRTVLDGVSLSVQPGETVALLGPNGAGKTTAVEILEGYRAADGGSVRVLGQDPRRGGPALRARVGLMLQGGGLDPRTTPREALRLYAAFHEPGHPAGVEGLLELVGLRAVATTRARRLSGGERQRLALALALVGDPEVLVLDEPTAGMDPEARQSTRELVASLHAEGRTILLTTHDLGDVERLADRVLILHGGRIVADGSPSEVAADASPQLRVRLARALEAEEFVSLGAAVARVAPTGRPEGVPSQSQGSLIITGTRPDPEMIAAVAAWCAGSGIQIKELRSAGGTLEERYLALTGDSAAEASSSVGTLS
ncbi:MAG: ABC transporter ATP-binding protein [Chloroflexota bacterium]